MVGYWGLVDYALRIFHLDHGITDELDFQSETGMEIGAFIKTLHSDNILKLVLWKPAGAQKGTYFTPCGLTVKSPLFGESHLEGDRTFRPYRPTDFNRVRKLFLISLPVYINCTSV